MPTQTQCPRKYQKLHYVCSYSWHGSWPVPSIKAPQWEDNKPIQQALHIIGWCEIILAQDLPCFTDPQPSLSTLLLGAHSLFIVSVMSHQRTETKKSIGIPNGKPTLPSEASSFPVNECQVYVSCPSWIRHRLALALSSEKWGGDMPWVPHRFNGTLPEVWTSVIKMQIGAKAWETPNLDPYKPL